MERIERIKSSISPQEFFKRFVQTRSPVIIEGHLNDAEWRASERWATNDHMRKVAGEATLEVEQRGESESAQFGLAAPKKKMKFSDFLDKLESDSDRFYLTTQTIPDKDDGTPERLAASPVAELRGDIPLRPKLMGNLVPQNLNIWMGNTKKGSSSTSGLHHDFHDNLYVLIRGRKRFRLFAPHDAPKVGLRGKITKIHSNGLINYDQPTRSDGLALDIALQYEKARLDEEIEQIESKLESATNEEKAELRKSQTALEERIDELLDQMLELETGVTGVTDTDMRAAGEQLDSEDDEGESFFDFVARKKRKTDSELKSTSLKNAREDGDVSEDESDGDLESALDAAGASGDFSMLRDDFDDMEGDPNSEAESESEIDTSALVDSLESDQDGESTAAVKNSKKRKKDANSSASSTSTHDHFSKICLDDERKAIVEAYPEFDDAKLFECEINAGEMLYLPASWLHEVCSSSSDVAKGASPASSSGGRRSTTGHVAFNYWFYPPRGEDEGCTFEEPYADSYWAEHFRAEF